MDFIGFIVGMLILLFPPMTLREQVNSAGEDIGAWFRNHCPWHLKRVKSFFVRHALMASVAIMVSAVAWFYTLGRLEPGLRHKDFVLGFCFWGLTAGQFAFALLNYLNGRIHYRDPRVVTQNQRATATRCLSRARALRDSMIAANQRFNAHAQARDPLAVPGADLMDAARIACRVNRDLAVAYREAAEAQAQVHRTTGAVASAKAAAEAMNTVSSMTAVVPGDPLLEAYFNETAQQAALAEQAAERSMAEEDARAYTWLLPTRFSLPHFWAVAVVVLLLACGVDLNVYAVLVEDRWLFALSFVPIVMAYAIVKVAAEVFAWLLVKGTKAAEFITTKAAEFAVAFFPGDTLATARARLGDKGIDILPEEEIAKAIREWTNLLAIMWGPYAAVVFWVTNPMVAVAAVSATLIGAVFSIMYLQFGKKKDIDEATEKTTRFFWKWGKWITAALVLLGGLVEFDSLMNRVAGITPFVVLERHWFDYVKIAAIFGIIMWVAWKAAAKLKGNWEKGLKPVAVLMGAAALLCLLAPMARSAGGESVLAVSPRVGPEAEKPVVIQSPAVQLLTQPDGRQEMVITFLTKARQSKGVVRFDSPTANKLGLPSTDVPVLSYRELVPCANGVDLCRKHVVVIPDQQQVPHGSYRIVMRRWLTVESSPSYRI